MRRYRKPRTLPRSRRVDSYRPSSVSPPLFPAYVQALLALEDRRLFYPEPALRPALSFPRSSARIVVSEQSGNSLFPSPRVSFAVPRDVSICVRRKQRREVLHAKGVAGGRVSRRRRRNQFSDVEC